MVEGKSIHKSFGPVDVLKGIDVRIGASEIVSILGASGAGKTTLLQILSSLDQADQGEVYINGTGIHQLSEKQLRSEERRVGKECRARWARYHEKKKET